MSHLQFLVLIGLVANLALPTVSAKDPRTIVVWNGLSRTPGHGWTTHQGDPKAVTSIKPLGTNRDKGRRPLDFRLTGHGWLGSGWNWERPVDISQLNLMTFWIKVTGPTKISDLEMNLTSFHGPKAPHESTLGPKVMAASFVPGLADGSWHEASIPLSSLRGGGLDSKMVNEVDMGFFAQQSVDCHVLIDRISFESGAEKVQSAFMTKPYILWDGQTNSIGNGWVAGNSKRVSIATIAAPSGQGSKLIHLLAAEPNTFIEFGWQWAPWYPTFKGTDFSQITSIGLRLRVSGPHRPTDLSVSLASPGDHQTTPRVSLVAREPTLMDGQWHDVEVPMTSLFTDGSKCDRIHVIQVIFGTWNGSDGDFGVEIGRIAGLQEGHKARVNNWGRCPKIRSH